MYTLELLREAASHQGFGHLWKHFESKLSELFVDDENESKVGVVVEEAQVQWVSTFKDLRTAVEGTKSTMLILNRYNSWSKIDITLEAFAMISNSARITPFFLQFVVGMGQKNSSKDEDFMACYSTFSSKNNCLRSRARTHGPWSCRQSALHHSYLPPTNHSAWVVIQPPENFDLTVLSNTHPMYLHVQYLRAAISNWREYLDSIDETLKLLNQHIASPNSNAKFETNLSRERHLHLLKRKIHNARMILINTKSTLSIIAEHESDIAKHKHQGPEHGITKEISGESYFQTLYRAIHEDFQRELRNISREIDTYIETTNKLFSISDDLKSIPTQYDTAGNKDMAVLADLVLMLNLVLSFFSTELVWYGAAVEVAESKISKIQVRSEVTVCWSSWWNWTGQRKLGKNGTQKTTHP
ncbi:hypothetical protein F5B18DRAFT_666015 [Nemania serpens]|nr:hypothetical protein F5B18DRAFT_666015 [Nemania serpens]